MYKFSMTFLRTLDLLSNHDQPPRSYPSPLKRFGADAADRAVDSASLVPHLTTCQNYRSSVVRRAELLVVDEFLLQGHPEEFNHGLKVCMSSTSCGVWLAQSMRRASNCSTAGRRPNYAACGTGCAGPPPLRGSTDLGTTPDRRQTLEIHGY